ncbi:hypothetical protein MCOR02_012273 [Pyricularia oryzae]|nr:hypothetical protein MCOR02_012273 [Pyricularia oryzae]KAI6448604.1 hypothetical protein MCOR17_010292 [Pyricularia oryzae]KAI6507582.1 hypothetical protein MCOR13_002672 [Pyricularia oryzae]
MDFIERKHCRRYLDIARAVAVNPYKHTVRDVLVSLHEASFKGFDDSTPDQDIQDAGVGEPEQDGEHLSALAVKQQYLGFPQGPVHVLDLLDSQEWKDHMTSISRPGSTWAANNRQRERPRTTPKPHQLQAIEKLCTMARGFFKGGFLAHPPGMGKTMSVLCAAFEHLRQLGTACEIRTFILYVTAEKCLSAVYNEVQCNVKPLDQNFQSRFSAIVVKSLDQPWSELKQYNLIIVSHELLIESWVKVKETIKLLESVRLNGVEATISRLSEEQLKQPKSSLLSILHNTAVGKNACLIVDKWPFGDKEADFTKAAQAMDTHSTFLVSDRLVSESNDWRDVYNQISILPVQPFANKAHFEAMFDTKHRSRRQGQDAGYQLLACLLDGIVIPHWLWGPFVPLPPLNRKRINTGYDSELGDGVHGLTVDALQKGALGLASCLAYHSFGLASGRIVYDYHRKCIAPVCTMYGGDDDGPAAANLDTTLEAHLAERTERLNYLNTGRAWLSIVKAAPSEDVMSFRVKAVLSTMRSIWERSPGEAIVIATESDLLKVLIAEAIRRESDAVFAVAVAEYEGGRLLDPLAGTAMQASNLAPDLRLRVVVTSYENAQHGRWFGGVGNVIMCNQLVGKSEEDRVLGLVRHVGAGVPVVNVYDLYAPGCRHDRAARRGYDAQADDLRGQDVVLWWLVLSWRPDGAIGCRPAPSRELLGLSSSW